MPCYNPIQGWRSKHLNANGKREIVFRRDAGFNDMTVKVPCGKCIGCRLDRSRHWAIRIMNEAQMHDENCFITLTYDEKHMPVSKSLQKRDFQLFMKKLRKEIYPKKVGYFHCGEYGDKRNRPHYHAIIFGHDFKEQKVFDKETNTIREVRTKSQTDSKVISRLWTNGFNYVGDVSYNSAAYVARYVTKKVSGKRAKTEWIDEKTGEVIELEPEYVTMSTRPAIGLSWYKKYGKQVVNRDSVVLSGREYRPPRYYNKLTEKEVPHVYRQIVNKRIKEADKRAEDNTSDRLRSREIVAEATLKQSKRRLENA